MIEKTMKQLYGVPRFWLIICDELPNKIFLSVNHDPHIDQSYIFLARRWTTNHTSTKVYEVILG